MVEPLILCENLVKIFQVAGLEVVALQGLDLTVDAGEILGIVGASGSGKTTLLNVLGGSGSAVGRPGHSGWQRPPQAAGKSTGSLPSHRGGICLATDCSQLDSLSVGPRERRVAHDRRRDRFARESDAGRKSC